MILEWHQDLWGKCAIDTVDHPSQNANGAPDWTCPPGYEPSVLDYATLFDRLWANQDGLLDALIAAWGTVTNALGNHPALLG